MLLSCADELLDRIDINDELIAAFQDFIDVMSEDSEMAMHTESLLKAGPLPHRDSPQINHGSDTCSEYGSNAVFEDALESFGLDQGEEKKLESSAI